MMLQPFDRGLRPKLSGSKLFVGKLSLDYGMICTLIKDKSSSYLRAKSSKLSRNKRSDASKTEAFGTGSSN